MKKLHAALFLFAFTFCFAEANAQKMTFSTLEKLASYQLPYDSTVEALGFDEGGSYVQGKDSAAIYSEEHNTNIISFSTNKAALYTQMKADITKSGYTTVAGEPNTPVSGQFEKPHYTVYYINQKGGIDAFGYQISVQYDPR